MVGQPFLTIYTMSKISSVLNKLTAQFNSEDVITFKKKDGFSEIKSWAYTGSPELDWNLRTFGFPAIIATEQGPQYKFKSDEAKAKFEASIEELLKRKCKIIR